MNKLSAFALGLAIPLGFLAQTAINTLDKATAQQCRTHDWPVEAKTIHVDWCRDNGYPVE